MKIQTLQSIPALLALGIIGFRYYSQWCIDTISNSLCYGTWVHWIYISFTSPLFFFAIYLLPIAIILTLVSREMFKSWIMFATWAIPLSFIFIFATHVTSGAYIDFFPFYRDDAARLVGGVFAAASLILIVWKSIAFRRNRN
jgi:hypothetical protein